MKPHLLVIGVDGAGLDIVESIASEGRLPHLERLMRIGARAALRSTTPATTFPAWTTFMTGASPSSHGVPDFTIRRGYRVRFAGASDRRLPTLFAYLESLGLSCGAAWFPATYPPEPLAGYQISGWDSPVTDQGDDSFVHPAGLHTALESAFDGDHLRFASVDEFDEGADRHMMLAGSLVRGVRRRTEIALWLMAHRPVDAAFFCFQEADTAAHHLWPFHDPSSPRRPARFDSRLQTAVADVYAAIDEAVGALVSACPEARVIVLSDHGSGGTSDVSVFLNRILEDAGLLAFRRGRSAMPAAGILRGRLPGLVPASLRRGLFRIGRGLAPSVAESVLRFGGIDWSRTVAFSEELGYAPSVWFNQLGREPLGLLPARERERAALAVEAAVRATEREAHRPLFSRVMPREDLHRGRMAFLFPDIVLDLARPGGHAAACLRSPDPGPSVVPVPQVDQLGGKGRSLPGGHTGSGLLIVAGSGVPAGLRLEAGIEDVASIACGLLGLPAAPWFEGRSPPPLPQPAGVAGDARVTHRTAWRPYDEGEERAVADRLARLGYI